MGLEQLDGSTKQCLQPLVLKIAHFPIHLCELRFGTKETYPPLDVRLRLPFVLLNLL